MKRFLVLVLMSFLFLGSSFAQKKTDKEQQIRKIIENKHFKFTARSVTPMSGSTINLTSEYDLIVDSTSIESWLPFYGRAYQTDYGSTEGGIKFKENAKVLEVKRNAKKDGYEVRIEVDTSNDSYKIFVRAGDSGYATMAIISNRKQSISYYGIIEPLKE